MWRGGQVQDLGTLPGGKLSSAESVNDAGLIAGNSDVLGSKGGAEPDVHPVVWIAGQIHDLGLPPGFRYGKCVQVNQAGEVVGYVQRRKVQLEDIDSFEAFTWSLKDGMRFINENLWTGFGYHVSTPYGVNDRGEILASGKHSGRPWEQIIPFYILSPRNERS